MRSFKALRIIAASVMAASLVCGYSGELAPAPDGFGTQVCAVELPAAPKNIKISLKDGSAVISWDPVPGADAYRVYMYDPDTKTFVRVVTVAGTKAAVAELTEGKHYFKVAAAVKSGSSYVSGDPTSSYSVTVKSAGSGKKEAAAAPAETSAPVKNTAASQLARKMGKGWNLGNTMESWAGWLSSGSPVTEYEKAWGQPKTTKEMITGLKNAGFSSVRVPVAWSNKLSSDGKYTISEDYFDRVDEIVGYVLDNDMYCIINIHWDGGWWEDFGSSDNKTAAAAMERYKAMWTQIAKHYAGYSDKLIFESANEELGDATKGKATLNESYARVNEINQTFVDVVRSSGEKNKNRFLLIAGYNTDIAKTCDKRFSMPSDTSDGRLLVSVHYYTPSTFCIADKTDNSWGYKGSWGTEDDIAAMRRDFEKMKKFTDAGYGVIIGEYGVCKTSGRVKEGTFDFFENVLSLSEEMGYCAMIWDCNDWYNRNKQSFNYPELADIY